MKKVLLGILAMMVAGFFVAMPVTASCTCPNGKEGVETSILGENGCYCEDDGKGSGITHILQLVIDIFSILVGILGVLGITVVGIQYLTSGGNEAKMTKAKQRLLEIVIGLVIYVVLYGLLKWLLPDFN